MSCVVCSLLVHYLLLQPLAVAEKVFLLTSVEVFLEIKLVTYFPCSLYIYEN